MLYRDRSADCSESHAQHTNTLYPENSELLKVTAGGTYPDDKALICSAFKFKRFFFISQVSLRKYLIYSTQLYVYVVLVVHKVAVEQVYL